jgi:hypothetical protein
MRTRSANLGWLIGAFHRGSRRLGEKTCH